MKMWEMKNLLTDSIIRISAAYRDIDKYKFNSGNLELFEALINLEKVIKEIKTNRTDEEEECYSRFDYDDDWGDR